MEKINLDQETEDWLIAFFNGELEENEIEKIGEWKMAKKIEMLTRHSCGIICSCVGRRRI